MNGGRTREASPPIVLRDALPADRPLLLVLWRELMEVHTRDDPRFALAQDADARFVDYVDTARQRDDYRVRVATWAGDGPRRSARLVGFTIACVLPNAPMYRTRWIGYVNDICVTREARGRGIGRALVLDALDWMRDRGAESFEVHVADRNPGALEFWRAMGAQAYLHRMSIDPVLARLEGRR